MFNESEIIRKLMYEIGLDINKYNIIIDQDTNQPIMMGGKFLKYSFNNKVKLDRDKDIYFNPLTNLNLMKNLFSYYLSKLENENIYFPVYFLLPNETRDKQCIVLRNGTYEIKSNYYKNIILAYLEIIFKIKGGNIDFTYLDKGDRNVNNF